jgi:hypothetical protein
MKRVLLYSPDVIGHPRIYCRVIADALASEPCEILIAMGFTENAGLAECADLTPLLRRERVRIIDTRLQSRSKSPHLTAEEIVDLQRKFHVDTTLFIEADKSNAEFRRIAEHAAPRFVGRTLGIFANTSEWYPGEDSFTGESLRIIAPTIKATLGNVKRTIFNRSTKPQYFYEKTIIGSRVLDEILVKDERLADWRGAPVYWMPEISRPAATSEAPDEAADFDRSYRELEQFLERNQDREPVLYFGDAAYYKGYDLFLRFLTLARDTCGIHAGRLYDDCERVRLGPEIEKLRESLKNDGRLYERNDYVHSQCLKELYFGTVRIYLTTHRLALSSSTMIQAVELGKPILVPDRGLLKHRVLTNGIGAVYRYADMDDLKRKAEALWQGDLSRFEASAKTFWQRFSDAAVRDFFVTRLLTQP